MDYLGRVSNILELARGDLPPRIPYLASERWPFHWFWFLIAADLSTLAGVSAFSMNKLLPAACIILFLASFYHVSRYFEKKYLFIAAVLLFTTLLASHEYFGLLLQGQQQKISWTSFFLSPGNAEEGITSCYNSLIHNYIFSNHSFISLSFFLWSLIFFNTPHRFLKVIIGMMLGIGTMYQPFFCLGSLFILGCLSLLRPALTTRSRWRWGAIITSLLVLYDLRFAPLPLLMLLLSFYRVSIHKSAKALWLLVPAGVVMLLSVRILIELMPRHGSVLTFVPGNLLLEERQYSLAIPVEGCAWSTIIAFNLLLVLYLFPLVLCIRLHAGPKGRVTSFLIALISMILLNAPVLISQENCMLHVPGLMRLSRNFFAMFASVLEMGLPLLFIPFLIVKRDGEKSLLFEISLLGSIAFYLLMNTVNIYQWGNFLYKTSVMHRLMLSILGAYGVICFVSFIKWQSKTIKITALIWATATILLTLPFTIKFVLWNLDTSTEPTLQITDGEADLIDWIKNNTPESAVIQGLPPSPREHLGLIVPFMNRRTGYVQIREILMLKGPRVAEHYRRLFSDAANASTPKQFQRSFRSLGVDYICVFDYADEAVKAKLRSFAEEDGSIQKVYSGKAGEVFRIRPTP